MSCLLVHYIEQDVADKILQFSLCKVPYIFTCIVPLSSHSGGSGMLLEVMGAELLVHYICQLSFTVPSIWKGEFLLSNICYRCFGGQFCWTSPWQTGFWTDHCSFKTWDTTGSDAENILVFSYIFSCVWFVKTCSNSVELVSYYIVSPFAPFRSTNCHKIGYAPRRNKKLIELEQKGNWYLIFLPLNLKLWLCNYFWLIIIVAWKWWWYVDSFFSFVLLFSIYPLPSLTCCNILDRKFTWSSPSISAFWEGCFY